MKRTILFSVLATALLGGSALAADLPTRKAAPAFAPPAPVYSWTGFYIGVNGGYGGDEFRYPFSATFGATPISASANITSGGFLGGVQAGYNWQFGASWVAGLEADIDATSIKGRLGVNAAVPGGSVAASGGSDFEYLGTVRGRLGYLVTDRFLLFGTGGLAYGGVRSFGNVAITPGPSFGASKTIDQVGWAVGAGAEYMITQNVTFKTEYLYADLGSGTLLSGSGVGFAYSLKEHATANIVRAGLNYKF